MRAVCGEASDRAVWSVSRAVSFEDLSRCLDGLCCQSGAEATQLVEELVDERAGRGERQAPPSRHAARVLPRSVAELVAGNELCCEGGAVEFLRPFVPLPQQRGEGGEVDVGRGEVSRWLEHVPPLPGATEPAPQPAGPLWTVDRPIHRAHPGRRLGTGHAVGADHEADVMAHVEMEVVDPWIARRWWLALMSNAVGLVEDAVALSLRGSYGRAQALLVLAVESTGELGVCTAWSRASGRNCSSLTSCSTFPAMWSRWAGCRRRACKLLNDIQMAWDISGSRTTRRDIGVLPTRSIRWGRRSRSRLVFTSIDVAISSQTPRIFLRGIFRGHSLRWRGESRRICRRIASPLRWEGSDDRRVE